MYFRDAESNKTFHTCTVCSPCALCMTSEQQWRSQNNIWRTEKRAIQSETGNGHLELPCLIHLVAFTLVFETTLLDINPPVAGFKPPRKVDWNCQIWIWPGIFRKSLLPDSIWVWSGSKSSVNKVNTWMSIVSMHCRPRTWQLGCGNWAVVLHSLSSFFYEMLTLAGVQNYYVDDVNVSKKRSTCQSSYRVTEIMVMVDTIYL